MVYTQRWGSVEGLLLLITSFFRKRCLPTEEDNRTKAPNGLTLESSFKTLEMLKKRLGIFVVSLTNRLSDLPE